MTSPAEDRVCENCGRWVDDQEVLYHVRIEVFAEPDFKEANVGSTAEETRQVWDDFLRELEQMTDEQVEDANAQVHEEFRFLLCGNCRSELHTRIRRRRQLLEGF